MSESTEQGVLSTALGLFDAMSPNMLRRVRDGREQGARVTIDPRAVRRLLGALDAHVPGLVDEYVAAHAEAAQRRKEEKTRA